MSRDTIIEWGGRRFTLRRFYWTVIWRERLIGLVVFPYKVLWDYRNMGWPFALKCWVWYRRYWDDYTSDADWIEAMRPEAKP